MEIDDQLAGRLETSLLEIWTNVFRNITRVSEKEFITTEWWNKVKGHYNEDVRHYHTLTHIKTMLDLLQDYQDKIEERDALALAIFFHDVIYNPKAKDNEEQSADLFQQFASQCLLDDRGLIQKTHDLIMATKCHKTEAHETPNMFGNKDVHYFLDFDMQVLGWPQEDYEIYAEQIRQEYIHIPYKDYCNGRSKVLTTFLQTPNIFATKDFRDKYEQQARANIQTEIDKLQREAQI